MNAWPIMQQAATQFADRLRKAPYAIEHQVPAYGASIENLAWTNVLLSSPSFRRGHIETFSAPGRVYVLHVCIFPHLNDAAPIFGFDMIAGPARVTGIFLDLSPTTSDSAGPYLHDVLAELGLGCFRHHRSLPEWGDIFSPDCMAIRPADLNDVQHAIQIAQAALDACLLKIGTRLHARTADISAGQARYVAAQRRNEHTFRMLAGLIGSRKARDFIDEVLFPEVPT